MTALKKIFSPKLLTVLVLIVSILGVFYFETSVAAKILAVFLGILSIILIFSITEMIILVTLYFGVFDLYNIRYGLAVPWSVIMIFVFALTAFLFYAQLNINSRRQNLDKNLLLVYFLAIALIILEIFLAMSLWPVDPKTKSFVIVLIFYLIFKIFYLYIDSVLNLKKTTVFIVFSLLILAMILIFNWKFGF